MKTLGLCVLIACSLSGCSVDLIDKRISREEIAEALKQRDEVLLEVGKAIKALRDEKADKVKPKK